MITALDYERISYINDLMHNLNSSSSEIYESLCDREYKDTKKAISDMQIQLKSLSDSLNEDF